MILALSALKKAQIGVLVGLVGYAGLMTWLWLGARDDAAAERAECNARVAQSVVDAEKAVRIALEAAQQEEIDRLGRLAEEAARRMREAEAARLAAESRPPVVREVIREVAVENPCIDTAVPDAVLDSLR